MDSYIDFSFDIKNDTKKGNALMLQLRAASEIKKTDDDLESKSSAHGYSAKDLAEYKPPESFSRERRASIASGAKNGRNKMNSRQLLARQAEATEKEDEKFKELQLKLTRQFDALQRKSLKSLIVSLWMTTLGLIILLSANLAMMQTVNLSWLAQYRWEQTSQGLRFYLNRIYLDVRRQAIAEAKLYDMQDPVAHALRWADTLTFDADRAVDGMNDVYELSDASSKAAIWNAVSITMHDKTSLSLFAAISTYGRHGAALGSLGKARKYPIQNYQNHTSFRFVLDNGLRISWAMKEAVEKERESRQKSLDGPSIGTSVLLGISLGLQYLLVGKVVIPKLQRFHAQQMRITLIFTKIPKARIKEIVQKMQAINDSLASLLDHKRRVGEKGQKVEKVTEQNTEQEGAGGLGRTNTIAKKEEKEKPRAETGTDENTIKTGKENVNDVASQVQLLFWILAACLTITDAMLLLLLLLHFDPQYGSRLSSTIAITDFRAELVLENALAFEHILADKTSWAVPEDLRKTFITQHHHTLSDAWVALLKSSTPVVMNAAWLEDRKSADYISMNTWVADVPPIVGSWSSWIPASTIKNDMPYNRNNPRALPLADENRYTGSLSLFEATCLQAKDRLRNDSFLSSACVNSSLGIPRHGGYRPILLNSGLSVTSFSSLPHLITEVMFSYEWFTEAQPGSIGTPVPYFDFADTVTPALVYSGLPNWQKVASDEFLGSLNVASFSYAIISGASIVIVILVHVLAQRSFSGLMAQTVQVCEMFKMIPAKALEAVTDLSQFAEELANMEFKKTNTVFEYLRNFFMRMWQTTKLEMDDVQDEEKNLTLKIENGLRLSKTSQLKEEEDGEKRNVGKQNNVGVSRRQTKLKGIVKTMTLSEEEGEVSSLDPLDTPVQPPTGLAEKEAGPVSFSLNRGTRKSSMRMAVTVESDADISETGVTPFRPRMRTLSLRRGSHQSDVPVQSVAWKSNELAEVEGHGSLDA
ncbi:hypothetical protein BC829DRAFT_398839 [Chytridium lagenaria]|nr:hypothetical protein BC829DRAFT_398839 [Chytridium lagenaria]